MERNWLIHGLDKKAKGELDELDYSMAKKINKVSERNPNKYTPPARRMVILILFSVIFLWALNRAIQVQNHFIQDALNKLATGAGFVTTQKA